TPTRRPSGSTATARSTTTSRRPTGCRGPRPRWTGTAAGATTWSSPASGTEPPSPEDRLPACPANGRGQARLLVLRAIACHANGQWTQHARPRVGDHVPGSGGPGRSGAAARRPGGVVAAGTAARRGRDGPAVPGGDPHRAVGLRDRPRPDAPERD